MTDIKAGLVEMAELCHFCLAPTLPQAGARSAAWARGRRQDEPTLVPHPSYPLVPSTTVLIHLQ